MSSLIMTKTNAERAREYRARIRASKPPKKPPKSGLERNREWRERKKQLQMEFGEGDGLHDPAELYAFKQEMVCEEEPRDDEGSCHEKFSLDGPIPVVDSVGGLKEVPGSGLLAAVKQEHVSCPAAAKEDHLENDPLGGCGDDNASGQPHQAEMCKTKDKSKLCHSHQERKCGKMTGSGSGATRRKLCPILPLPDFLKDVQVCNTRLASSRCNETFSPSTPHPSVEDSRVEEMAHSEIFLNGRTCPSTSSPGVGENRFRSRGKKRPATDGIDREILQELKRQPSYDEEVLFCLSLVGSLKRLRPQDLIRVKSQFYQLLADQDCVY